MKEKEVAQIVSILNVYEEDWIDGIEAHVFMDTDGRKDDKRIELSTTMDNGERLIHLEIVGEYGVQAFHRYRSVEELVESVVAHGFGYIFFAVSLEIGSQAEWRIHHG